MQKRGEKSLQMIFGLFMLLIISLVVLSMFFKFVKQGTTKTSGELEKWAKEASKEAAISNCEALCDSIADEDSLLDFCSTLYQVDWNEDGPVEGKASQGRWWFCEKKIPCFVLVPNCKNRYDGNRCRQVLAEYRSDLYVRFLNDAEGLTPDTNGDGTIDADENLLAIQDGCDLPYWDPDLPIEETSKYNWKQRFCFNTPATIASDPSFVCVPPE
ncbi:hypothetical protein JXB41_04005 [Candidatus Woesearchaeota archaeon]|nr:hypothetical protein [Candidatus Woesearchaeota archaeon]